LENPLDKLIAELGRLPGIGHKSAERLAYFIFKSPILYAENLAQAILDAKGKMVTCSTCFSLSEEKECKLCNDPKRNNQIICVVEEPKDVFQFERIGNYQGQYHVLQGTLSPSDDIGPKELRIAELEIRVKEKQVQEIILALNPSIKGDATAHYISERLKSTGVLVTKLASGIPIGANLEFVDNITLETAMKERRKAE
jgi:recombination protein RecR